MAKFANFFTLLRSEKIYLSYENLQNEMSNRHDENNTRKTVKLRMFANLEAKSNRCQIGAVKNCKTTNFCIIFVIYAVFVEFAVPVRP